MLYSEIWTFIWKTLMLLLANTNANMMKTKTICEVTTEAHRITIKL